MATEAEAQQPLQRTAPRISVQPRARIAGGVDRSRRITIHGSVSAHVHSAVDRGLLPDSTPLGNLTLVLTPTAEQKAALDQLLLDQQNPSSENYHKWVTPQEFGEHFGAAQGDIDRVTGWLQAEGLTVGAVAPGRLRIGFSGTVGRVRAAFGTELHSLNVDGEEHFANTQEISIPVALSSVVAGVARLDNFRSQPAFRQPSRPPFLSPGEGRGKTYAETASSIALLYNAAVVGYDMTPADFRAIYSVPGDVDGSGIKIGLPESQDPTGGFINNATDNADYEKFNTIFGLPSGHLSVYLPYGDPGVADGGGEASLDLQWAHAIAPGAQIVMVSAADNAVENGVQLAQDYLIDNNLVDIISTSYAIYNTSDAFNQLVTQRGEQAAAQGISMITGSGDWGSGNYDNSTLAASIWTSNPYVTSVGGTIFNTGGKNIYWWGSNAADYKHTSVGGHIPEEAWSTSGGGKDTRFAKPDWQVGVTGIPNDGYRDFPDVSLLGGGYTGYLTCMNGGCNNTITPSFVRTAGTSASGPAFAAMAALLAQKYSGRQGLLNRGLYKLGASEDWNSCNGSSQSETRPSGSCVFYDITSGSNAVSGQPGYGTGSQTYNTNTGYDLVTGLGSVNASRFISAWGSISYLPTTTTLILPSTASYGDHVPISGTVSSSSGGTPTGFVSLTTSSQSFGPYALDGSGNFTGTAQGLTIGNNSVTASYGGDAQYATSKSSVHNIAISKIDSIVTATVNFPDINTFGSANHNAKIDVKGTTGYGRPTGLVHTYYNIASQGASYQDFGTTNLGQDPDDANAAELSAGFIARNFPPDTYSLKVDYLGDDVFKPSTSSAIASFTILKAPSATVLGTGATSIVNGTSVTLTATVSTSEGQAAPGGTVQFYQKGIALGSPVSLGGVTGGGSNGYTGFAVLNTTALLPGTDAVTAVYSGDANVASSSSSAKTITVDGYHTTLSLSSDRTANIFIGSAIYLTANVFTTQPSTAVTGSVTYYINGANVGTQSVAGGTSGGNQKGTAILLTAALQVGTNTIFAVYNGDTHYNPGTSYSIQVNVIPTYQSGFVNPAKADFGTVSVGSSSAEQDIFFTNNGTEAIPLSGITITGPNASSFTVVPHCNAVIPTVSTCYAAVTFTPQTSGSLSATLTFQESSDGGPHTVPLTGTALPAGPYATLSATSLSFGNLAVTTTSDPQTVKLTNIGNATMTGISFVLSAGSPNFTLDGSGCGASLAVTASCTVSVRFTPQATGTLTGTISEYDNSHAGATSISLSGAGTPVQGITLAGALHQVNASLNTPYDSIADSYGNIYISDTAANKVYKIDPQGVQTALPIIGLVSPMGMTMDSAGNLYVISNGGTHQVYVIKYASPSSQRAYSFFSANGGTGVAVDSSGIIYLADPSSGSVWYCADLSCTGTGQLTFSSLGVALPAGIAIDKNNTLYVSSGLSGNSTVTKKANISGSPTTVTTSLTSPIALSVMPDGSLLIGDAATNKVYRYVGTTGSVYLSNSNLTNLTGVHADGQANVYVTSRSNAKVLKSTTSPRLDMGVSAVGSTLSASISINVPAGNSVSTITVGDLAGNSEWAVPTGNTCTVVSNVCSFTLNFTPAYPGLRDGTLSIKDSLGNVLNYFLYGLGQGPQAALLNGTKTTVPGTWVPGTLRSDSAGNVYVVDLTDPLTDKLQKITPAGAVSTAFSFDTSTLGSPMTDVAVDSDGTYYTNTGMGIQQISNGQIANQGFLTGGGIALNGAGNFYGTDQHYLYKPGDYNFYVFVNQITPFANLSTIALDGANNVYIATLEPAIYKYAPNGTTTKLLDSSSFVGNYLLQNPTGLAVDAGGAVYVADASASAVFRVDGSGSASAFGLDFSSPSGIGIAVTPQGVMYLSDQSNKAVYRYAPDTSSLAFGSVPDQTSSPAKSVLLTNTGNTPLTFSNISTPSGYAAQYNDTWCTTSSTVSGGGSCDLTLVFNPQSLGSQNGTLTFADNSLNSAATQSVALTGTSVIGAEAQLRFVAAPPASINAKGNLGTVTVEVVDTAGNRVTTASDALTLTLSGPGSYSFNASLVNGLATFNLSGTPITQSGTFTVTAATATVGSITSSDATLTVNSLSQTIAFGTLSDQTYGVAAFSLGATATSGLGVTYTVTGPATISGSTLSVTGVGSVTVTAHQAGNSSYTAAGDVDRSFNVGPATLTVTPSNVIKSYGALVPPLTYGITGYVNSDAVEFPVVSGAPAMSTTATTLSAPGAYPITAALGTLTAANYIFQFGTGTLTVEGGASQTIVFDPLPDLPVRAGSYRLTAFSTSGLPVSYAVSGPASVSGAQLTVTGTGLVTVTATQAGNGSYTAASSAQQSFTAQ